MGWVEGTGSKCRDCSVLPSTLTSPVPESSVRCPVCLSTKGCESVTEMTCPVGHTQCYKGVLQLGAGELGHQAPGRTARAEQQRQGGSEDQDLRRGQDLHSPPLSWTAWGRQDIKGQVSWEKGGGSSLGGRVAEAQDLEEGGLGFPGLDGSSLSLCPPLPPPLSTEGIYTNLGVQGCTSQAACDLLNQTQKIGPLSLRESCDSNGESHACKARLRPAPWPRHVGPWESRTSRYIPPKPVPRSDLEVTQ